PSENRQLQLALLFSAPDTALSVEDVLQNGDLLESDSMPLVNGETVWLFGRVVPLQPEEMEHIAWLDNEFQGIPVTGDPLEQPRAAGVEIYASTPMVIQL